jgi:hypothetical protein
MAILNFLGFEAGWATECHITAGTISLVTTPVATGGYAFRANPTTTATGYGGIGKPDASGGSATFNVATAFITFKFRADLLPASGSEEFFRCSNSGGLAKLRLRITSGGIITIYDSSNVLVYTGSTALSTSTWYEIGLKVTTSATTSDFELQVNRAVELSGTASQLVQNAAYAYFGKVSDLSGQSVDFYYDDVVVDDASFVYATVKMLAVNANGYLMQYTSGTGASDYTQVAEIPMNASSTYVRNAATPGTAERAFFALEDCAAKSISGTILGAISLITCREETSTTSSANMGMRIGGADYFLASPLDLSAIRDLKRKIYLVDPSTSSAWTTGGLDSAELGFVEAGTVQCRVDNVGLNVLYITASGVVGSRLSTTGVGA